MSAPYSAIRDRIDREVTRCAGCDCWLVTGRKTIGIFFPSDGSTPLGYALCRYCVLLGDIRQIEATIVRRSAKPGRWLS